MKKNFYLRIIAVVALLCLFSLTGFAQKGFFQPTDANNARLDPSVSKHIDKFLLYRLKTGDLRSYLLNAPLEFKNPEAAGLALEFPLPDGRIEMFNMFESPMLSTAVAAKHPEVKTYTGKGTTHGEYAIRLTFTSIGVGAIILGVDGETVYFDKVNTDKADNLYRNYFTRDAQSPQKLEGYHGKCGTLDAPDSDKKKSAQRVAATASTGTTLRMFRLAMAGTAEYTAFKQGDTEGKEIAYAALLLYVSSMNIVYRRELSVEFTLVTDETWLYIDTDTDGYSNESPADNHQSVMLDENQTALDAFFGDDGYDIGHVLGYEGSSGGGIAARGSLGVNGEKGQGVSGVGDGSFAPVFDDQLIQHEIGHQFDMSHSFNSHVPVCTTRAYATSVEPGAGTTIMSYGYTCDNSKLSNGLVGDDNYEASYQPILNFHTANYDQANAHIATITPASNDATSNAVPVITLPGTSWTIPISTPFALTGSATDANGGDVLSYSWEGTNISDQPEKTLLTDLTISEPSSPPFFRSYAPVPSGTRYYPRLPAVLDGSNYAKGDKLPNFGISTTHRLTVRDNKGASVYQDVTVTVAGSGPFLITNDGAANVLGPSTSFTNLGLLNLAWSVNGTNAAPVNCQAVDIFLSTDGGLTFPHTLASGIANSGVALLLALPPVNTTKARIKLAASNGTNFGNTPNIFFDISDVNFVIGNPLPVTLVSFDAKLKEKNTALLTWTTATETDNAGFDIEMSNDARQFVKVGFVDGKGTTKATNKYEYSVSDLAGGTYYFRLKQLDRADGKFTFSQIRSLELISLEDLLSVYPNPTNGKLKFNSGKYNNETFGIKILNQAGKEVMTLPARYTQGSELDVTGLPTGFYNIKIQGQTFTENLKFVKM